MGIDLLPNKVYEAKRQDFGLQRSGLRRAHSDGVCEPKAAKLQAESRDFRPKNYSGASLMVAKALLAALLFAPECCAQWQAADSNIVLKVISNGVVQTFPYIPSEGESGARGLKSGGVPDVANKAFAWPWFDSDGKKVVKLEPAGYIRVARRLPDGRISGIRMSSKADGGYEWAAAYVDPNKIERVYWGEHRAGTGHVFVVLEFAPGGYSGGRYLLISVESMLMKGESLAALLRYNHPIVWILSSLENYLKLAVERDQITTRIWPFSPNIGKPALVLMAKEAIKQSLVRRDGELFSVLYNNCTTNALAIVNAGLGPDQKVVTEAPKWATSMLFSKGLLANNGYTFSPDNPGGGLVELK